MGTTRPIPLYQRRNHLQHYKMMKLVVLALALSAAYAGTVYTGLPLGYPGAYTGLPTLGYSSLGFSGLLLGYKGAYTGLPFGYAGAYSGLPVVAKAPITYTAADAPPSSLPPHTGFTPVSRLLGSAAK